LYLSLELAEAKWKVASTIGHGQKPRERTIGARDVRALKEEIDRAKSRFGLEASARVVSCYEAGREGFWLQRWLRSEGVENHVVDSSSIEVNRRARRAKSDQLDVRKLLTMLMRYENGEKKVWSVVRVPSVEEEDRRHLHRELRTLKEDQTRQVNRIRGLLASQGVRLVSGLKGLASRLDKLRLWDGSALAPGLRWRIEQEWKRLELIRAQILEAEKQRRAQIQAGSEATLEKVRKLLKLRAIGETTSWTYVREIFGWRQIRNRRELGALAGLTPTPYQSGSMEREQGISKAGNRAVRALAIEIAWRWLFLQPNSELSRWYMKRFGNSGSVRLRKIGIVALARKLLIALWRYLEHDVIPAGAELKAAA
jgi:transposase